MSPHSPEPWSYDEGDVINADGCVFSANEIEKKDIERIIYCVNACAGVPLHVLKSASECAAAGRFGTMAAMYRAQRDNLLDALSDLIKAYKLNNRNEVDRIIAESNALIKRVKEEL